MCRTNSPELNTNDGQRTQFLQRTQTASRWNPFRRFDGADDARNAAHQGAVVSGLLALSYIIQSVLYIKYAEPADSLCLCTVVAPAVAAFALLLTWAIYSKHAFWAAAVLLVWCPIEVVFRVNNMIEHKAFSAPWLFVYIALIMATILCVRATLWLRSVHNS